MRFTIDHPIETTTTAVYGFDPALGYFVDVSVGGTHYTYDAITPGYRTGRPLQGALLYLVEFGFYSADDLRDALLHVERRGTRNPSKRLRIAVEVISNFMLAGD